MIRATALVPLFSLLLSPAIAGEPDPPERAAALVLAAGVAKARNEGKRVFLLFGSPA